MAKHHPPSVAWKGFCNPGSGWASKALEQTIRLGIGQAIPEVDWNWVRVHPTQLVSGSSIGAQNRVVPPSQRCFGGFHGLVQQGLANGPSSQARVPLEGPFWGVFHRDLTEMNEMRVFRGFASFAILATSFGCFKSLRWVV